MLHERARLVNAEIKAGRDLTDTNPPPPLLTVCFLYSLDLGGVFCKDLRKTKGFV